MPDLQNEQNISAFLEEMFAEALAMINMKTTAVLHNIPELSTEMTVFTNRNVFVQFCHYCAARNHLSDLCDDELLTKIKNLFAEFHFEETR